MLAIPFTLLRSVNLSRVADHAAAPAAIDEEPLGTNSKFFLQFSSRVWNAERMTANCLRRRRGPGRLGRDRTTSPAGRHPGRAARRAQRARLGPPVRPDQPSGPAPGGMIEAFLGGFDQLFPHVSRGLQRAPYFVWSPGDPHILGAYSYLAVGQYTAFNGIQGSGRATCTSPASRHH